MPPHHCKVARVWCVWREPFELIFDSACRTQTVYNFILMWMHVTCSAHPAARQRFDRFFYFIFFLFTILYYFAELRCVSFQFNFRNLCLFLFVVLRRGYQFVVPDQSEQHITHSTLRGECAYSFVFVLFSFFYRRIFVSYEFWWSHRISASHSQNHHITISSPKRSAALFFFGCKWSKFVEKFSFCHFVPFQFPIRKKRKKKKKEKKNSLEISGQTELGQYLRFSLERNVRFFLGVFPSKV